MKAKKEREPSSATPFFLWDITSVRKCEHRHFLGHFCEVSFCSIFSHNDWPDRYEKKRFPRGYFVQFPSKRPRIATVLLLYLCRPAKHDRLKSVHLSAIYTFAACYMRFACRPSSQGMPPCSTGDIRRFSWVLFEGRTLPTIG